MNPEEYKKIVNKFTTGITVITGNYNNKPFGITVNSFSSLSLEPILVSFNIDKKSHTNELIINSDYYNINILSKSQEDLVWRFAKKDEDRFKNLDYQTDNNNIALLTNNLATLHTKKYKIIDIGDHNIIIAEVINGDKNMNQEPLIYYNSKIK